MQQLLPRPQPDGTWRLAYRPMPAQPFPFSRGKRHLVYPLSGLGQTSITSVQAITGISKGAVQISGTASSGLPISTKVESSVAAGLATASGFLATNPATAPIALILLGAAAVADFLGVLGIGSGCGQTCVLSSQYADKASAILDQNIHTYFSIPAPRSASVQSSTLIVFDSVWNDLVQQCSNPALGDAGRRCITDRQAGACTWHQTADKVPPWGTPAAGACWNWFNGYRDPIASDPNVISDAQWQQLQSANNPSAVSDGSVLPSSSTIFSTSNLPLFIGGGLILFALMSGRGRN